MLTMTYGVLPERNVIAQKWAEMELDGYEILTRNKDEWAAIAAAINVGIDSYLEAIAYNGRPGHIIIHNAMSLHVLIRRLVELWENGNEHAGDFASCVLETLDIEWV